MCKTPPPNPMQTKRHVRFLQHLSKRVKSKRNKKQVLVELQTLQAAIQRLKESLL